MEDASATKKDMNLRIYSAHKRVPDNAKDEIKGGKLSGFTSIKPMFRIKALTAEFGPCGEGWYTEEIERWMGSNDSTPEVLLSLRIRLYYKLENGEWSKPIDGEGSSKIVAVEKGKPKLDEESYKKAYTDALSVCCKYLGIGADVYWETDSTDKYDTSEKDPTENEPFLMDTLITEEEETSLVNWLDSNNLSVDKFKEYMEINETDELTVYQYRLIQNNKFEEAKNDCRKRWEKKMNEPIEKNSLAKLKTIIRKIDGLSEGNICDQFNCKSLSNLTNAQYADCIELLNEYEGAYRHDRTTQKRSADLGL